MTGAARRHLAIDLGASSGRVMEVRIGDAISVRELHRFANAPGPASGAGSVTLAWPVESILDEIRRGLAIAARDGAVDSIGIDSWAVDYALVDDAGVLVRPVAAYRDPRTARPFAALRARLGDAAIYAATGIAFQPFNTIYQLAADAADPTRPLERAARLLMLPDLVAFRLCGATTTERTNASSTQLLDAHRPAWREDLAAAAGVPMGLLPPIVEAGAAAPLGTLRREIAEATGLPARTPILAAATHDTASAVVAAPIDPARDLYVSSGTWSLVGAELPAPVTSDGARDANLTNERGAFGTVRFLRNVSGLWLLQQCAAAFAAAGRPRDPAALVALARSAPARRSVVDPDDARFLAPGDMPERLRAACAERGEPVPDDDAALARCAIDSVAAATARAVRLVAGLAGIAPQRLAIVGGGSANDLLNESIADATGLPVVAGPIECTALGNGLVQHAALAGEASAAPGRALVARDGGLRHVAPDPAHRAAWADAAARLDR